LLAALAAAALVFLFSVSILPPTFAQDTPAAEEIGDPNAGGPAPAEQEAAASDPDSPAESGQSAPATEGVAPQDASPPAPNASPVVMSIRAKLADQAFAKDASPQDVSALVAFYNARTDALWMTDMGFSTEAQAAIDEIHKADDWGLSSAAFDLPAAGMLPASLDEQALGEIKLDLAILKYARHARGGRIDPDKLKNVDLKPPPTDPTAVLSEIAAAPRPNLYLQSLHPTHEQFKRLHQALLKARAESEAGAKPRDMQKILLNMERWRWMPQNLGTLHVWLNVPEFMVYIVKNGKTIHSEKIVVGKPVYATPVFSADLKSIVFNPEWTVPSTIIREDLLPRLRGGGGFFGGNSSILKKHKLYVKYNGKRVDPGSIDWNRVNMAAVSFHQDPGPTNVLGKVKFLYPNRHSVYMHDTIKRELLNRQVRAEGHHCPRVSNPGKVAAVILAEDRGMPESEIEKLLAKGHNSAVTINGRVPVHTTYFTGKIDDDGKLVSFADIYGMDGPAAAAVFGKQMKTEAVADNAEVKPAEARPQPAKPRTASSPPPSPGFPGALP
jgi:murein L,D-transpeptidase YcbB/YkuD